MKEIFLIIIGFILLINGADYLVDGASNVAKRKGIPQIIIGLTIVSIGTSLPELFVSMYSIFIDSSDMSLGNIIGSNICNLLLILGLSCLVKPIKFKRSSKLIDIPLSLFVTCLFMLFCNTGLVLSRLEGFIFLLIFLGFIIYTIKCSGGSKDVDTNSYSVLKSIFYIVIGVTALKFGGDLTVKSAVVIANNLNVSEKVIGLTILAIGTSLPELVTSVMASLKGNDDIAIGNVIGSNIFNIIFIMGAVSIYKNVNYNITYNIQFIILIFGTFLLSMYSIFNKNNIMGRINGLVNVLLFIGYIILLLVV